MDQWSLKVLGTHGTCSGLFPLAAEGDQVLHCSGSKHGPTRTAAASRKVLGLGAPGEAQSGLTEWGSHSLSRDLWGAGWVPVCMPGTLFEVTCFVRDEQEGGRNGTKLRPV